MSLSVAEQTPSSPIPRTVSDPEHNNERKLTIFPNSRRELFEHLSDRHHKHSGDQLATERYVGSSVDDCKILKQFADTSSTYSILGQAATISNNSYLFESWRNRRQTVVGESEAKFFLDKKFRLPYHDPNFRGGISAGANFHLRRLEKSLYWRTYLCSSLLLSGNLNGGDGSFGAGSIEEIHVAKTGDASQSQGRGSAEGPFSFPERRTNLMEERVECIQAICEFEVSGKGDGHTEPLVNVENDLE